MRPTLNLASRTYVNRRALYAIYALLIAIAALVLVLSGIHLYRLQAQKRQIQGYLAEVEAGLGKLGGGREISATELDQLRTRIGFARETLAKDAFRWTGLLDRLERVTTDGISIASIQPNYKEGSLKLTGLARSVEALRNFLDSLIASPDFSEIYLLDQARVEVRDSAGTPRVAESFSIQVKGAF